jgi:hypothetical protein
MYKCYNMYKCINVNDLIILEKNTNSFRAI